MEAGMDRVGKQLEYSAQGAQPSGTSPHQEGWAAAKSLPLFLPPTPIVRKVPPRPRPKVKRIGDHQHGARRWPAMARPRAAAC